MISKTAFAFMLLITANSCGFLMNVREGDPDYGYEPIAEDFLAADKPEYELVELSDGKTYRLMYPWNYEKPHNADRMYPLVVALHGSGGSYYAPCIVNNETEMQRYPCFFLAPHNPGGWTGEGAAWVRAEIEKMIRELRIDPSRLYLLGYSMGGSGSYPFAEAFYNEYGYFFAGIVRLAGQSRTSLSDSLVKKTAIWYHIGLDDTANNRVGIAEQALQFLKEHPFNNTAREFIREDIIIHRSDEYPRSTSILIKLGAEVFKLSRYQGMGHSPSIPFSDPQVLEWLFTRSLSE